MDLLNEARQKSFLLMPGDCNNKLQSLYRQISDYCITAGKGTAYRDAVLFIIEYLYYSDLITYGEKRDLTVYYDKDSASSAIAADLAFLDRMGPIPRTEQNIERFNKLEPNISIPEGEIDFGSASRGDRPPSLTPSDTKYINNFIGTLINTGRFNCSHVDDLIRYTEQNLRRFYTTFYRGQREGRVYTDKGGVETVGRELPDFKFNPNYRLTYNTIGKLLKQQPKATTINSQDIILSNPNSVFLFFTAYYIPALLLSLVDVEDARERISDNLMVSRSIEDFIQHLERDKEIVSKLRNYDDEQIEELNDITDMFIDLTIEFKEHTEEYMFGRTQGSDVDEFELVTSTVPVAEPLSKYDRMVTRKKSSSPIEVIGDEPDLSSFN